MQIKVFEDHTIRQITYKGEEHYSVIDVIRALTHTMQPSRYWVDMKRKIFQSLPRLERLKLRSTDGKFYKTDCATREVIFRIMQEIPSAKYKDRHSRSKKVSDFKVWLARMGEERLQEMVDPSKSIERGLKQYVKLGYDNEWIRTRYKGIEVRNMITTDWSNRGITKHKEFARLTNTINLHTFGMNTREHKKAKGLRPAESLRNNMDKMELLHTMNAEMVTTEINERKNSYGYKPLKKNAAQGGTIASKMKALLDEELSGITPYSPVNL